MRFTIFDANNLVHRAWHSLHRRVKGFTDSEYSQRKMVMENLFQTVRMCNNHFYPDCLVFCFDSRSWRKSLFDDYKISHKARIKTPDEITRNDIIHKIINEFADFIKTTNNIFLERSGAEADDFIAFWTFMHPEDEHIIISGDSDFKQLVKAGVSLFAPVPKKMYTVRGVFYQDNKIDDTQIEYLFDEVWKISFEKDGTREVFDPGWELFQKIIRGDDNDDVPTCFPRVQTKTMKKVYYGSLLDWNNFMNGDVQTEEGPRPLAQLYDFNRRLIDLNYQPDDIKEMLIEAIQEASKLKNNEMVEYNFTKICTKYKMTRLMNNANDYITIFNKRLAGEKL